MRANGTRVVCAALVGAVAAAATTGGVRMVTVARATAPAPRVGIADLGIVDIVKASRRSVGLIETRTPFVAEGGDASVVHRIGTGFLIDGTGDMVTNCHVLDRPAFAGAQAAGPTRVAVVFPGLDRKVDAVVKGCDKLGDIAVVKIPDAAASDLTPLRFADPEGVEVGEEVIAIGFAQGMAGEPTVTRGIVSGLRRSINDGAYADLVQTDAPMNPGDSGGPLLDRSGAVIGVNTYGERLVVRLGGPRRGGAEDGEGEEVPVLSTGTGMSFARGAASARRYAEAIIAGGRVDRVSLGLAVGTVAPAEMRLPRPGVLVRGTDPLDPDRPSIEPGDIVTAVSWGGGSRHPIADEGSWNDVRAMIRPGEWVTVSFYRMSAAGKRAALARDAVPASEFEGWSVEVMARPAYAGLPRRAASDPPDGPSPQTEAFEHRAASPPAPADRARSLDAPGHSGGPR